MRFAEFFKGMGRPVAYYPNLCRALGSVTAAIFLQQLTYWWDKKDPGRTYVYKTARDIEEETGLTYHEQLKARKLLKVLGILDDYHARLKHETHFKLNFDQLSELWEGFDGKGKRKVVDKKTGKLREDSRSRNGRIVGRAS